LKGIKVRIWTPPGAFCATGQSPGGISSGINSVFIAMTSTLVARWASWANRFNDGHWCREKSASFFFGTLATSMVNISP